MSAFGSPFDILDPPGLRAKERRERIATAVLAGLAGGYAGEGSEKLVPVALVWADALIAELDK